MKKQSGSVHLVIIIVLVVGLLGVLGFVLWQNVTKDDQSSISTNTNNSAEPDESAVEQEDDPYEGWVDKKFDNVANISYKLPSGWSVAAEYRDQGAMNGEDSHLIPSNPSRRLSFF